MEERFSAILERSDLRYMEERFSAIPERSDLGYMEKLFSVISHSLDRIYGGNKNGFKFA